MESGSKHFSTSAPLQHTFESLANGDSPTFSQSENERLVREIQNTDKRREVVDFDTIGIKPKSPRQRRKSLHPSDERQARDPRDEAKGIATSNDESHYTQIPTVDFDGLSWPSEKYHHYLFLCLYLTRYRHTC
jgi:hypothetical protein